MRHRLVRRPAAGRLFRPGVPPQRPLRDAATAANRSPPTLGVDFRPRYGRSSGPGRRLSVGRGRGDGVRLDRPRSESGVQVSAETRNRYGIRDSSFRFRVTIRKRDVKIFDAIEQYPAVRPNGEFYKSSAAGRRVTRVVHSSECWAVDRNAARKRERL